MLLFDCYLRKGTVYIPTTARVENNGPFVGVEPTAVLLVSDTEGLHRAFEETFARGNPSEPHRLRADLPSPPILKYAGVRTWGEFARGTLPWTIKQIDGIYKIIGQRKSATGGWEDDPEQIMLFPPGTNEGEVINRMIVILQDAAKKPKAPKH